MKKPFKISNKTRNYFKPRKRIISSIEKGKLSVYDIPQRLRHNRDVMSAAIEQNWRALAYAAPELKEDPAFSRLAEEQKEAQTAPKSQSLNFLWLNLDLPAKPDPEDGSIRMPLPEEYISNAREAGKRHPQAAIHLWIDSRRLTKKQLQYLHAIVEKDMPNVHVKDLMSIPEYANEELYNRAETKADWRSSYYGSNVWLQVDAAKILISLQGDYNQHFFADLDHAHVDIKSSEVQEKMDKYGFFIGSNSTGSYCMENQLWGFDRTRKDFFQGYYNEGLKRSYKGRIAYESLRPQISEKIFKYEPISEKEVVLPIGSKGLEHAVQPGHEWSGQLSYYPKYEGRSFVPANELTKIFNGKSPKPSPAVATPSPSIIKPAARMATI